MTNDEREQYSKSASVAVESVDNNTEIRCKQIN